jgi:hypothetical protein
LSLVQLSPSLFQLVLGLHTLLNHVSLFKFCKTYQAMFNQTRLQIPISYQAIIKRDCQYFFLTKQ